MAGEVTGRDRLKQLADTLTDAEAESVAMAGLAVLRSISSGHAGEGMMAPEDREWQADYLEGSLGHPDSGFLQPWLLKLMFERGQALSRSQPETVYVGPASSPPPSSRLVHKGAISRRERIRQARDSGTEYPEVD